VNNISSLNFYPEYLRTGFPLLPVASVCNRQIQVRGNEKHFSKVLKHPPKKRGEHGQLE
jgi:hypothetical protein